MMISEEKREMGMEKGWEIDWGTLLGWDQFPAKTILLLLMSVEFGLDWIW
jgi:hypothetical protein